MDGDSSLDQARKSFIDQIAKHAEVAAGPQASAGKFKPRLRRRTTLAWRGKDRPARAGGDVPPRR